MNSTTISTQDRFNAAVATLRSKINFTLNVDGCCRGCITPEDANIDISQPYAWTYSGQGNELVWKGGVPFFREVAAVSVCWCVEEETDEDEDGNLVVVREGFECEPCLRDESMEVRETFERAGTLYVNHGGEGAAAAVRDAFAAEGFTVEWDGVVHRSVMVAL